MGDLLQGTRLWKTSEKPAGGISSKGSIPSPPDEVGPPGVWSSLVRATVSKTVSGGSNPSTPVSVSTSITGRVIVNLGPSWQGMQPRRMQAPGSAHPLLRVAAGHGSRSVGNHGRSPAIVGNGSGRANQSQLIHGDGLTLALQ
jgi:hypothetical protein